MLDILESREVLFIYLPFSQGRLLLIFSYILDLDPAFLLPVQFWITFFFQKYKQHANAITRFTARGCCLCYGYRKAGRSFGPACPFTTF